MKIIFDEFFDNIFSSFIKRNFVTTESYVNNTLSFSNFIALISFKLKFASWIVMFL